MNFYSFLWKFSFDRFYQKKRVTPRHIQVVNPFQYMCCNSFHSADADSWSGAERADERCDCAWGWSQGEQYSNGIIGLFTQHIFRPWALCQVINRNLSGTSAPTFQQHHLCCLWRRTPPRFRDLMKSLGTTGLKSWTYYVEQKWWTLE